MIYIVMHSIDIPMLTLISFILKNWHISIDFCKRLLRCKHIF